MSSIAVFLVLGGATAFAASQLGKNSVGSKQLKKNAVTAAKIKSNAVTKAKIKNNAVNGAKVDESTLSQVPSAANAVTAGTATKVNGVAVSRFSQRASGEVNEVELFGNGHFRATFSCDAVGNITIRGFTLSDHASIESYGNNGDTSDDDFNIADNPKTLSSADEQRDIVYADESGNVVHLSYLAEELRPAGPKCVAAGFAEDQ